MAPSRSSARRRIVFGSLLFVAVAATLTVMAARDLRTVSGELLGARQTLESAVADPVAVRSADSRAATQASISRAVASLAAARRQVVRSPAFTVARFIPVLSRQRGGLLNLIGDSRIAANAGQRLLTSVDGLTDNAQLREGKLPYEGFAELATEVARAGTSVGRAVRPSPGLLGPLGQARRTLNEVAESSSGRLLAGADALTAARTFLGGANDRTMLVAMQNNAEMRDQGMVLSYAVARFANDGVTFDRTGNIGDVVLSQAVPDPVPPGTKEVFGFINPTKLWQSVNASADFAVSGRTMISMYRQATGQTLDGVIAIDVPGLAALLRVVGPVQVAGIAEPLTAENAPKALLHDLYNGLAPNDPQANRRERLGDVVRSVIEKLTTGTRDTIGLGRELGEAASGGHLRLWSSRPDEEQAFERTGLGGGPATTLADRTFHVAVENRTASKLDYYVQPKVRQEVTLARNGDAHVHTTIDLDNQAPAGAPPSYQLGPQEGQTRPGEYIAWFLLWGPAGARQGGGVPESGLTLSNITGTVQAGEKISAVFDTVIPDAVRDGRLTLRLVPQSRLQPMTLDVRVVGAPGWKVEGPTSWQGAWDRTKTLSWRVGH